MTALLELTAFLYSVDYLMYNYFIYSSKYIQVCLYKKLNNCKLIVKILSLYTKNQQFYMLPTPSIPSDPNLLSVR
jgi:hypothetical protein